MNRGRMNKIELHGLGLKNFLIGLTLLFIAMKMMGYISWSFIWVLSPGVAWVLIYAFMAGLAWIHNKLVDASNRIIIKGGD